MKSKSCHQVHSVYHPLNSYHGNSGFSGICHVLPEYTVWLGTAVHLFELNVIVYCWSSTHDSPFVDSWWFISQIHFANNVISDVTVSVVKFHAFWNVSLSIYHHPNVEFALVGSGVGSVAVLPWFTFCDSTELHPLLLNVTVLVSNTHPPFPPLS